MNLYDQIRAEIGAAPPPGSLSCERFTRFSYPEGAGNTNGSAKLLPGGDAAYFVVFGTGQQGTVFEKRPQTPKEKADRSKQIESAKSEAKQDRKKRAAHAAATAVELFALADEEVKPSHPVLARYGLTAAHGARDTFDYYVRDKQTTEPVKIKSKAPVLAVPIHRGNSLISIQYLFGDGHKHFHPDGETAGGYFIIGKIDPAGIILQAEGFGTGAHLHEKTGHPVVVAFNAGNHEPVAISIRQQYPDAKLFIASDNDAFNKDGSPRAPEDNTGIVKATAAAKAAGAQIIIPQFPEPRTKAQGTDFLDLDRLSPGEAKRQISEATTLPVKSLFVSAADLLAETPSIVWAIHKLIEADTTGQLFGPSGSGKTFIALCIALAVLTGGCTLDGRRAEPGAVLYLNGEGRQGLARRIKSGAQHHRILSVDLANFFVSRHPLTFDDTTAVNQIISEGRRIATTGGIKLIIVDTLARHLNGDENTTRDMVEFVRAVDTIRDAFPGSVALIVHHTGNGEDARNRSRGSSSLKAAMDFEINCNDGLLTFTKMKDAEIPAPIPFKLVPVQIGYDDEGEPVASCVVEYGQRSKQNQQVKLSPSERSFLTLIEKCPVVENVRQEFIAHRLQIDPDQKPDTIRKAYRRNVESLEIKQIIHIKDGCFIRQDNGTSTGQARDMSRDGDGTDITPPYKGGEYVPPSCPVVPDFDISLTEVS